MTLLDRARLIAHMLYWRATWSSRDIDYCPKRGTQKGSRRELSDKFVSAREAAGRIPDGATVLSCGLASHARCSIFFWAVRELFERTGHPSELTWLSVGAQGGRGKVPGTVEELGVQGLLRRYVSGHLETAKSLLRLADEGQLELHTLPQGEMSWLIEAQGHGEYTVTSSTGIGTFLDPRVGRGSCVTPSTQDDLVQPAGRDALRYSLPRIDVALANLPYADAKGNIYFKDAASLTESIEAVHAARYNGGKALITVCDIIDEDQHAIGLPAEWVDAIVVNPRNEQTGSVRQRRPWKLFTPGGDGDDREAEARLRFINEFLHITPSRGPVDNVLARLAARVFTRAVSPGAVVNIGVGFPEEAARLLSQSTLNDAITFTTETGVYGGLPTPGIFFGAAVNPERLESSAWMFHYYREHLDATMLGFLEVDSAGNVNVSKRGPRMLDYVGPGGFPSIVNSAKTIVLIGSWMENAEWRVERSRLVLVRVGEPKFVEQVDEVTFNGSVAFEQGKRVFFVTTVGTFVLTDEGLTLVEVMPGIDIDRDILAVARAKILIPRGREIRTVPESVVTGDGFELSWLSELVD